MKNKIEAERWFKQANSDLKQAKWALKGGFADGACFLAQQVVEKTLKSFLYSQGKRMIMGHSSFLFAQRCAKYDKEFIKLVDECKILDKYYMPARYPDSLPGGIPHELFSKEEGKKAIKIAEKIYKFVKRKAK